MLQADVLATSRGADSLLPGGGLGEGPGREPGRHVAAALLHASAAGGGASRQALRAQPRACHDLPTSRHPEMKDRTILEVFDDERASLVPLQEPFPLPRVTAAVPKTYSYQVELRPQPLQRLGHRRRPAGAGSGLRHEDRHPAGRPDRRRARPGVRPRPDDLRSLALSAGPGAQAGGAAQRCAVQGTDAAAGADQDLGAAGRLHPAAIARWCPCSSLPTSPASRRWRRPVPRPLPPACAAPMPSSTSSRNGHRRCATSKAPTGIPTAAD